MYDEICKNKIFRSLNISFVRKITSFIGCVVIFHSKKNSLNNNSIL
jgi:hypothetical protein